MGIQPFRFLHDGLRFPVPQDPKLPLPHLGLVVEEKSVGHRHRPQRLVDGLIHLGGHRLPQPASVLNLHRGHRAGLRDDVFLRRGRYPFCLTV